MDSATTSLSPQDQPGLRRRHWLAAGLSGPLLLATGCAGAPRVGRGEAVADARGVVHDPARLAAWVAERLHERATPDWLLLGEQHDANAHQAIEAIAVQALAARGTLAALVLEMADCGTGTADLPPGAQEAAVRQALAWNDGAWPWARYGPVVMAAVRAGVPVHGGNLPRARHGAAMADRGWDHRLPPDRLQALHRLMDTAHCGLLPPAQWGPMARIQIARDDSLAETLWALRTPERTVLLVTGAQHARRTQGVPVHLARRAPRGAAHEALQVVELRATDAPIATLGAAGPDADAIWLTPTVPPVDHCAGVRPRG